MNPRKSDSDGYWKFILQKRKDFYSAIAVCGLKYVNSIKSLEIEVPHLWINLMWHSTI